MVAINEIVALIVCYRALVTEYTYAKGSFAAVFLKMFISNASLDLGMFLPPRKFVKVRKLVRHSLSLGFAAIPVATTIHGVYRLLHVTGSTNVNECRVDS